MSLTIVEVYIKRITERVEIVAEINFGCERLNLVKKEGLNGYSRRGEKLHLLYIFSHHVVIHIELDEVIEEANCHICYPVLRHKGCLEPLWIALSAILTNFRLTFLEDEYPKNANWTHSPTTIFKIMANGRILTCDRRLFHLSLPMGKIYL